MPSITEKEALKGAAKCIKIVHKQTGRVYNKRIDRFNSWAILYRFAQSNDSDFEFFYEENVPIVGKEDTDKTYSRTELKRMAVPKRQALAKEKFGIENADPDKLVQLIIEAQENVGE